MAETGLDPAHNIPVLSVSEASLALKRTVEETFARVRLRGEISGFKRAASGHLYFSLKDPDAVIDGVCWRGTAGRLGLAPEDGMEVIATGRLSTYPGRSKYQIIVEHMELAGEGALLKLLEDRRKKLEAEGLFDPERKQPLPFLPDVIGVITSPTGAVIRDILHRLSDRFPCRVLLWPVLVQGDGAAEQVADAIRGFAALKTTGAVPRPDLLIVARGGGSIEDLWAFNEEAVVRAAAECPIPLISAVGHETDTTLIDFVSDRRAPTPTAAAEMAVPVRAELAAQIDDDGARLARAVARRTEHGHTALQGLVRGLPDLTRMIEERAQRLDDWSERLANSLNTGSERRRSRLENIAARLVSPQKLLEIAVGRLQAETRAFIGAGDNILKENKIRLAHVGALLDSYSYERTLDRGFALVTDADGKAVISVRSLEIGKKVDLRLHDGSSRVTVTGDTEWPKVSHPSGEKPDGIKGKPKAKPRARVADDRQGKLL